MSCGQSCEGGFKLGTPSRAAFAGRVRDLMAEDASVKPLVEPLLAIPRHDVGPVRPPDEAGSRHRSAGKGLPAAHERAGRRSDHRARLPGHDRPAGPLQAIPGRWRASRPNPGALSVGRDAHPGQDETALYEPAHALLVRTRKWSSLRAWG